MKEEIFKIIRDYAHSNPSIWHTPGHKGLLSRYDITEIDDSFPADSMELAQEYASKIFNCRAVRFLTGGSSMGIKAGILALAGDILVESNCHPAVFEGIKLANKRFFEVKNLIKNDLPMPITAQQLDDALKKNSSVKTVLIQSPDYYGQVADVNQILSVVKSHNVYLYVDSAHGAHFSFSRHLFPPSFTGVADACNISAHKTMPAFTQSAYLCINNASLLGSIDDSLKLLGTTSPSYLLLSGLEFAAKYCVENASRYDQLLSACTSFREDIRCLKNDDFTRLVVDAGFYAMSGAELYNKLKNIGFTAEKFDNRYVVFIVSITDTPENVLNLKQALLKTLLK